MIQVKAPHITHFELPFQIWITTSLLFFQTYVSCVPQDSGSSSYATFWWLARTLRPGILPDWIFPPIWAFIVIVHSSEGVYAATLARKHHMPLHIAVSSPYSVMGYCASQPSTDMDLQMAWVSTVTIFGFPVLLRLRQLIKQARIESIMKGH